MKKADVQKNMVYAQSVYPSTNIEWIIDKKILFIFFPVGSFSCPYKSIESIYSTSDGVRIITKKNLTVQWRSASNTIMTTLFY